MRRHPLLAILTLCVGLVASRPAVQAQFAVLQLRPVAAVTRHLEEGPLRYPRGVAWNRRTNEVWVADTGNHMIGAFTPDGTPLFATNGGGTLREPRRIAFAPDGTIWVLDNDSSRVARLDWRGNPLPSPVLEGLPEKPVIGAIAFAPSGDLVLGENSEGQVHVYDQSLKRRFEFGSKGTEEEQFTAIMGIAASNDWIVVVDATAKPVQLYNRRGEFQRGWGAHEMGRENFSLPQDVALDSKGHVVVIDTLRHEIKFFDLQGMFLDRFGGMGSAPGQVTYPTGVAADASGHLYVAEQGNQRVQVFAIEEVPSPQLNQKPGSSGSR